MPVLLHTSYFRQQNEIQILRKLSIIIPTVFSSNRNEEVKIVVRFRAHIGTKSRQYGCNQTVHFLQTNTDDSTKLRQRTSGIQIAFYKPQLLQQK